MTLRQALTTTLTIVPSCLVVGVVDLSTGELEGVVSAESEPPQPVEHLAAATGDLFRGAAMAGIEDVFQQARSLDPGAEERPLEEIIVLSEDLVHVFVRSPSGRRVLVTVCRANANMGMVLTKTRAALAGVEAAA